MKLIGSFVVIAVGLFLLCCLATIMGAAIGWVVGLFFSDVILGFLSRIGMDVDGIHLWEVGAALGFIGSFIKSTYNGNRSNG